MAPGWFNGNPVTFPGPEGGMAIKRFLGSQTVAGVGAEPFG